MLKENLYSLIDTIDSSKYEVIYNMISNFLSSKDEEYDDIFEDELLSVEVAKKQIEAGEYIHSENFDWGVQGDIKKIKGKENLYRIRVGNYRIFFSYGIDEIHLLTISLRKDAYKNKN